MAKDEESVIGDLEARLAARDAELDRAKRELDELARVMAHDLRAPLRAITSFGELLVAEYDDQLGGEGEQYLGFITHGAERMRDMLDALVRLIRLDGRKGPCEDVAVVDVLNEVASNVAPALEARGGRLVYEEDLGVVSAIRSQMVLLFQHLVENAIKFSEHAPRVTIRGRVDDDAVVIEVIDEGIGFPAHAATRIFDIFERAVGRDAYPGLGIGLAICKKVVEDHGGRIEAHSAGSDEGARFVVRWPP